MAIAIRKPKESKIYEKCDHRNCMGCVYVYDADEYTPEPAITIKPSRFKVLSKNIDNWLLDNFPNVHKLKYQIDQLFLTFKQKLKL